VRDDRAASVGLGGTDRRRDAPWRRSVRTSPSRWCRGSLPRRPRLRALGAERAWPDDLVQRCVWSGVFRTPRAEGGEDAFARELMSGRSSPLPSEMPCWTARADHSRHNGWQRSACENGGRRRPASAWARGYLASGRAVGRVCPTRGGVGGSTVLGRSEKGSSRISCAGSGCRALGRAISGAPEPTEGGAVVSHRCQRAEARGAESSTGCQELAHSHGSRPWASWRPRWLTAQRSR